MNSTAIRRISTSAHGIGTIVFLVALASMLPSLLTHVPHPLAVGIALGLLFASAALVAVYLALLAAGALDQPVAIGRFVPDAWESILISVSMVGVAWIHLSEVVTPESRASWMVSVVIVVLAVGLLLHRVYHLRIAQPRRSSAQPDAGSP